MSTLRFEAMLPTALGTWASRSLEHEAPSGFQCLIRIRDRSPGSWPPGVQLVEDIQTVLHEMLHAFFETYSSRFCQTYSSHYDLHIGPHGHGPAWQDAAFTIQKAHFIFLFKICR